MVHPLEKDSFPCFVTFLSTNLSSTPPLKFFLLIAFWFKEHRQAPTTRRNTWCGRTLTEQRHRMQHSFRLLMNHPPHMKRCLVYPQKRRGDSSKEIHIDCIIDQQNTAGENKTPRTLQGNELSGGAYLFVFSILGLQVGLQDRHAWHSATHLSWVGGVGSRAGSTWHASAHLVRNM